MTENLNKIKKLVYKQKPEATLQYVRGGNIYYNAEVTLDTLTVVLTFIVPITDIGNTDFYPEMNAKYLLRWLDAPVSKVKL